MTLHLACAEHILKNSFFPFLAFTAFAEIFGHMVLIWTHRIQHLITTATTSVIHQFQNCKTIFLYGPPLQGFPLHFGFFFWIKPRNIVAVAYPFKFKWYSLTVSKSWGHLFQFGVSHDWFMTLRTLQDPLHQIESVFVGSQAEVVYLATRWQFMLPLWIYLELLVRLGMRRRDTGRILYLVTYQRWQSWFATRA